MDALGFQRPPAKGGRSKRNRLPGLVHPNIEFRVDVNAHSITGDQRFVLFAGHRKLQGVHVYRSDVVNDRPHECAAVDDNFFAKETRAHECDFLGRAAVQPVHHPVDNKDDDDRRDEPQDQLS